ncbi:MAG: 4-vinyl reductase [Deltaproteobacteria bacterium]|nr:MAG: 4-vinyl reductase [Deltaproteobacteria bacterium]
MFKEERETLQFCWKDLGNIQEGRPNLGDSTSVTVYRLMQYTLRDVLIRNFGPDTAGKIYYEAGKKSGEEFCRNLLNIDLEFNEFIAEMQKKLKEHCVGIFRVEEADPDCLEMMITVAEDLDCSGLPLTDETVCDYDEGFIAGILNAYTGEPFDVKEVDCWATGARVCRFKAIKKG